MTVSDRRPPDGSPESSGADRQLHAQDSNRVYQAAGDQYIYDRAAPAPAKVTNTLLRDTAAFTGRDRELERLIATVARAAASAELIPIHAIDGMPGVGKTALAIHVGHLLAGSFPDGQLFIDLHAHTAGQGPVEPADALFALLSADGMLPGQIPAGLDERAARWRARMAGKKVLLIMDNAAGTAQVESLLPGAAGCLVLITSRRRLTGLGARHAAVTLPLETLPPDEAAALFVRLTGRSPEAEAQAVAELVRLCGNLPLAISLLAAKLRPEPLWRVRDMVDDLAATQDRLSYMHAEDIAVAAAFDLSYRTLSPGRRRFFRRLGLHPCIDIDVYAAAALDGVTVPESQCHLEALYGDHLLDQPAWGRYRMHELVGDYTRILAAEDTVNDRTEAVGRVLDYYRYVASLADRQLNPRTRDAVAPLDPPRAVPDTSHADQAMAWMRTELANLVACTAYAHGHGEDARLVGTAAVLAAFLRRTGPWRQAIALHHAAVAAARRLGDRPAEADALQSLGIVLRRAGDYADAAQALNDALTLYTDLGDRLRFADVLNELATVHRLTDDYGAADQTLHRALTTYRELSDPLGQAATLNNLAAIRWLTDDFPGAKEALRQAMRLYDVLDDRYDRANTLFYLGHIRRMTGDYPGATLVLREALTLYQEIGDRLGQANVRYSLGVVQRITEDYAGAGNALREALAVYKDLGDRLGQANASRHLGVVRQLNGDLAGAAAALEEALAGYRDLGDRLGQAGALHNLGVVVWRLTGDYARAAGALCEALAIYESLGNRLGQAETYNDMGTVLLEHGKAPQALAQFRPALRLAQQAHSPLEEAHAYEGIARCELHRGKIAEAIGRLRRALNIYERIQAPDAVRVASQINDLSPPLAS